MIERALLDAVGSKIAAVGVGSVKPDLAHYLKAVLSDERDEVVEWVIVRDQDHIGARIVAELVRSPDSAREDHLLGDAGVQVDHFDIAWSLERLTAEERREFLEIVNEKAANERQDPGRQEIANFLASFGETFGLIDVEI